MCPGTSPSERGWKDEGFTLLEIMIAICILMFGLLAVASMQASSIRGNALAGGLTTGVYHGSQELERIMNLSYDHADLSSGDHTAPSPPTGFTITWTVTDNSPIPDTKTVRLTTSWTEHGADKSATFHHVVPRII